MKSELNNIAGEILGIIRWASREPEKLDQLEKEAWVRLEYLVTTAELRTRQEINNHIMNRLGKE